MQFSRSNSALSSSTGIAVALGDPAAALAFDLRLHLSMLINKSLGVRDFMQWFNSARWDIDAEGDDDTFELMSLVDLRLAELTSGYLSEDAFIQVLREDLLEDGIELPEPSVSTVLRQSGPPVKMTPLRDLIDQMAPPPLVQARLQAVFVSALGR